MLKTIQHCFCQYLKNNIADIRLIHLDHVTYYSCLAGFLAPGVLPNLQSKSIGP